MLLPRDSEKIKLNTLRQKLETAGVDLTKWGKGQAKTLSHLQKELENQEAFVVNDEAGNILKKIKVSGAHVYHISSNKKYYLKESKQIFIGGRERVRKLEQAVAEKIRPNETPQDAMVRGLREELGLMGEIVIKEKGIKKKIRPSISYPGLKSHVTCYIFEVTLSEHQFRPEGYTEKQDDKITYFSWEELK